MSRLFDWWMGVPARTRILIPIWLSGFSVLLSICAMVFALIGAR